METKGNDGFLVVGGGIAGSTCAIELSRLCPSSKVTLVSPSSTIKTLLDVEQITPLVGLVEAKERSQDDFAEKHPGVVVVCDEVETVDTTRSLAKLAKGGVFHFSRCCVATGASPTLAYPHPRVFGIRDTESVENLNKRLLDAKVVLVVGNGGIAMELVHSLVLKKACQVVWAVRNKYIGNTFFDASASAFFLQNVAKKGITPSRGIGEEVVAKGSSSVGPDWIFQGVGKQHPNSTSARSPQSFLDIQFECELGDVRGGEGSSPVSVRLTNGVCVEADFVVSATGVTPGTSVVSSDFERGHDGGLCVDERMRVLRSRSTRVGENNLFAAGDCCCMEWPQRESDHWFQLRIWRQARASGLYAGQCMADSVDEFARGAFDLFVHATQFFGHQVALLGRYNGQGLGAPIEDVVSSHALDVDNNVATPPRCHHEAIHIKSGTSHTRILIRTTPALEYIKVIVVNGRLRGALLVGDTSLAETFENLILSATDVSTLGDELLSRDVDIGDFFD
eukprot:g12210.t1